MRGPASLYLPPAPGGVREDVSPVDVQPGWLIASSNYMATEGEGKQRPGYTQVASALASANSIIGIGFRGSDQNTSNIVLQTLTHSYHWNGSTTKTDITGSWATSTNNQPTRFATMQSGGTTWIARVNEANAVAKWNGDTASTFQAIPAAAAARDILVSSGHLVMLRTAENVVRWSNLNDIDTYDSLNTNTLDQTKGDIIAGRNISPLSFAIYKDDSVFLATRQAAAVEFSFEFISSVPGPVSPNAIVEFPWGHVWLGNDNAFYMFDGARVTPLSRALAASLGSNLHTTNKVRAHSMRRRRQQDEAWFFFPDAVTGLVTKAVSLVVTDPTSGAGRVVAVNPHEFAHEITASASWRNRSDLTIDELDDFSATIDGLDSNFATIDAMSQPGGSVSIIGDTAGNFYEFGRGLSDAGTAIAWEFTLPYVAPAGIETRFFMDGIESYWEKTSTALTVTVGATFSDSVSGDEAESTGTFDISTDSNHLTRFVNKRGKWVKIRHAAAAAVSGIAFRGARVTVFPRGQV